MLLEKVPPSKAPVPCWRRVLLECDATDAPCLRRSTIPRARQAILRPRPPRARVCVWVKGRQASLAHSAHSSWEPVIIVGGRSQVVTARDKLSDTLIWGGRQHSHPGALIGMKPAAFCEWVFRLLGATHGDSLDDIFPGSGAVSRAWNLYTSSKYSSTPSRLSEAQDSLDDKTVNTCGCGTPIPPNIVEAEVSPGAIRPPCSAIARPLSEAARFSAMQ